MTQSNPGTLSCVVSSWLIALLGGVLVAALLMALAGFSFVAGAFFGLLIFVIGGLVFAWAFCRSLPAPNSVTVDTPVVGPTPSAKPATAATSAKTASISKEKAAAAAKPSGAGQATPAPAPAQAEATPAGIASIPAKKPAAKKAAAKKPASKKPAAKASARSAVASDGKPETLTQARAGGADDLKQLKGVGPALEKTLNELGFYHFDQVAAWRKKDVEWVDSRLRFKGRIERDGWIEQAKILAKGGSTEFSKKVKKGDVY